MHTLYKKISSRVDTAIPPDKYLKPIQNKRKITARKFSDCVSKNIVEQYVTNNSRAFQIPPNKASDQYKQSFFVRKIPEWNGLANQTVTVFH